MKELMNLSQIVISSSFVVKKGILWVNKKKTNLREKVQRILL